MLIQIPFASRSERSEPLRRCVAHAAQNMGVSEHHVALLMSHFFEEVAHQVARNRLVTLPGLGTFGPKAWFPRNDPDAPGYCYPAFSGALPFRNLVRSQCSAAGAALDGINARRRHAHPSAHKGREGRMPHSTQRAFRDRVRAEARRLGFEVAPERGRHG